MSREVISMDIGIYCIQRKYIKSLKTKNKQWIIFCLPRMTIAPFPLGLAQHEVLVWLCFHCHHRAVGEDMGGLSVTKVPVKISVLTQCFPTLQMSMLEPISSPPSFPLLAGFFLIVTIQCNSPAQDQYHSYFELLITVSS